MDLLERIIQESGRNREVPNEDNIRGILQMAADGSPKFRYLCLVLAELVVMCQEKIIIFVTFPDQQLWLEKVCP